MEFTHKNWNYICNLFHSDYKEINFNKIEFFKNKFLVIKHDVECNANAALKIAKIEHSYGIKSIFYVQFDVFESNVHVFNKIKDLGHYIGYHYDVLDANDGDHNLALESFTKHMDFFKSHGFDIQTICPHGNPIKIRSGWDSNRDFWTENVKRIYPNVFDIVVDLPLIRNDYNYISDAGYSFSIISDIKKVNSTNQGLKTLDDFNSLIYSGSVILSTHPHRWYDSVVFFKLIRFRFIFIKFLALKLNKFSFFKTFINKFYFIAKKF